MSIVVLESFAQTVFVQKNSMYYIKAKVIGHLMTMSKDHNLRFCTCQ